MNCIDLHAVVTVAALPVDPSLSLAFARGSADHRTSGSVIAVAIAVMIGGIQWASAGRVGAPTSLPAAPRHVELGNDASAAFLHCVLPAQRGRG
jgi:hypothetical protein